MNFENRHRKVVLSMDGIDFSRDGVEHVHLPDFIMDDGSGLAERPKRC